MMMKKKHEETFCFIVLFNDEKYQKSFKRAFLPLKNLLPRARVSRESHAWRVRAANGKTKVGGFALLSTSHYHACEHITRKSRADSCTHCLHARYKCRAGVNVICTLTGWSYIFHFGYWLYSSFYIVGVGAIDDPRRDIKKLFFYRTFQ